MKAQSSISQIALVIVGLSVCSAAFAGSTSNCDRIASEIRAAVEKDPQKVLVIVEDAMVANESCACEIVKAAILASKANGDMIKQIVLTGTNVAPKMSSVIAECAGAIAPEHAKEVADASKKVFETTDTGSDTRSAPAEIRGVYLIQPSSGGSTTTTEKVVVTKTIIRRTPRTHCSPQSPSSAD